MMLKTMGLVAALVLASAMPAMAASNCAEPIAPAAVNGSLATTEQMGAAHDDVVTFLKQSDDYQACLLRDLNAQKALALKNKQDLDPAIPAATAKLIQSNQGLKEKVGAEYNAAVLAYKAKNPK